MHTASLPRNRRVLLLILAAALTVALIATYAINRAYACDDEGEAAAAEPTQTTREDCIERPTGALPMPMVTPTATPSEEAPAETEAPEAEAPEAEAPAEEAAPADQAPAEADPSEQTPAEEAPADETDEQTPAADEDWGATPRPQASGGAPATAAEDTEEGDSEVNPASARDDQLTFRFASYSAAEPEEDWGATPRPKAGSDEGTAEEAAPAEDEGDSAGNDTKADPSDSEDWGATPRPAVDENAAESSDEAGEQAPSEGGEQPQPAPTSEADNAVADEAGEGESTEAESTEGESTEGESEQTESEQGEAPAPQPTTGTLPYCDELPGATTGQPAPAVDENPGMAEPAGPAAGTEPESGEAAPAESEGSESEGGESEGGESPAGETPQDGQNSEADNPAPAEQPAAEAPAATGDERVVTSAYVTGYTWYDNTPAGSSDISHPVLHQKADGTGTYADPITIAVGHDLSSGSDVLDYPAGTRMYIPNVRRYFIVEDSCGDGPTPQNGACHNLSSADAGATTWVDMWVDGQSMSESESESCMGSLTGIHTVIINPKAGYPVASGKGVIHDGKCDGGYGESIS